MGMRGICPPRGSATFGVKQVDRLGAVKASIDRLPVESINKTEACEASLGEIVKAITGLHPRELRSAFEHFQKRCVKLAPEDEFVLQKKLMYAIAQFSDQSYAEVFGAMIAQLGESRVSERRRILGALLSDLGALPEDKRTVAFHILAKEIHDVDVHANGMLRQGLRTQIAALPLVDQSAAEEWVNAMITLEDVVAIVVDTMPPGYGDKQASRLIANLGSTSTSLNRFVREELQIRKLLDGIDSELARQGSKVLNHVRFSGLLSEICKLPHKLRPERLAELAERVEELAIDRRRAALVDILAAADVLNGSRRAVVLCGVAGQIKKLHGLDRVAIFEALCGRGKDCHVDEKWLLYTQLAEAAKFLRSADPVQKAAFDEIFKAVHALIAEKSNHALAAQTLKRLANTLGHGFDNDARLAAFKSLVEIVQKLPTAEDKAELLRHLAGQISVISQNVQNRAFDMVVDEFRKLRNEDNGFRRICAPVLTMLAKSISSPRNGDRVGGDTSPSASLMRFEVLLSEIKTLPEDTLEEPFSALADAIVGLRRSAETGTWRERLYGADKLFEASLELGMERRAALLKKLTGIIKWMVSPPGQLAESTEAVLFFERLFAEIHGLPAERAVTPLASLVAQIRNLPNLQGPTGYRFSVFERVVNVIRPMSAELRIAPLEQLIAAVPVAFDAIIMPKAQLLAHKLTIQLIRELIKGNDKLAHDLLLATAARNVRGGTEGGGLTRHLRSQDQAVCFEELLNVIAELGPQKAEAAVAAMACQISPRDLLAAGAFNDTAKVDPSLIECTNLLRVVASMSETSRIAPLRNLIARLPTQLVLGDRDSMTPMFHEILAAVMALSPQKQGSLLTQLASTIYARDEQLGQTRCLPEKKRVKAFTSVLKAIEELPKELRAEPLTALIPHLGNLPLVQRRDIFDKASQCIVKSEYAMPDAVHTALIRQIGNLPDLDRTPALQSVLTMGRSLTEIYSQIPELPSIDRKAMFKAVTDAIFPKGFDGSDEAIIKDLIARVGKMPADIRWIPHRVLADRNLSY